VDTFIQVVAASGPIVLAIMGVIVSDVQRIVDDALAKQAERNATTCALGRVLIKREMSALGLQQTCDRIACATSWPI
jgi:hypothetical protein